MAIREIVAEATKAAPTTSVSVLTLMGYPLSNWVLVLTFIYAVLQIVFLVRREIWKRNEKSD